MNSAKKIIEVLKLAPHPEGGYFREFYRSGGMIPEIGLPKSYSGSRNFMTSIYYLLESGQFSAFHKLRSDEIWNFYDGSSLTLHTISPRGEYKTTILGNKLDLGETYQFVVKSETWFAAEVNEKKSFSLVGCQVAPGFDFNDFEMGERQMLIEKFPKYEIIISKLTRR